MQEESGITIQELYKKLKDIFNYLFKKWILISSFGVIGLILGIIYSQFSKPVYHSTLSFVIEGDASSGGLASLASSFGLGIGGGKNGMFNSENVLELLKTRRLIQKSLLKPLPTNKKKTFIDLFIEMDNLEDILNEKSKKIHFKPDANPNTLTIKQNKIISEVYEKIVDKKLSVEIKNPDNSIIYLDISCANEEFARYFPEILIKEVSDYYIETKTRKAKLNYETIKKQTDSVRYELNNSITGVAAANDNTFLLNPAFNIKRVPSAHKEVNVQANTIILGELVKNLELSRMNLLNETPFIEIIDKPILPLPKKKIGKFKGLIIGGCLGSFLIIGVLILIKYFRSFNKKTENEII